MVTSKLEKPNEGRSVDPQITISLDKDTFEDLENLLYQLNWLNDMMKADRSNGVISAILHSVDPANKHELYELIEAITRINLSDGLIKSVLNTIDEGKSGKGGLK